MHTRHEFAALKIAITIHNYPFYPAHQRRIYNIGICYLRYKSRKLSMTKTLKTIEYNQVQDVDWLLALS